jgi:hypothetical protein
MGLYRRDFMGLVMARVKIKGTLKNLSHVKVDLSG